MEEHFSAWIRAKQATLRALEDGELEAPSMPIQESEPRQEVEEKPSVEAVRKRKNDAFSRMNRLHGSLEWLPSDQQRLDAALQILELEREVQACWKVIDRFEETGELTEVHPKEQEPEPFNPSDYDPATLVKIRNSDRSYLSKAKKKGYPQEKIEERKERIETINHYLNAIQNK